MPAYTQLNRPIVVVDYDPNWPALYEAESERISSALGGQVVQIEHIGSTAVPGLAAKPVIDISVGVSHYLRNHPQEAQRYQRLKRELAIQCGSDMDAYVNGKTAFVESVLLKARNLVSR